MRMLSLAGAVVGLAACGPTLEDDRPFVSALPFNAGTVDLLNGRVGGLALTEVTVDKVLLEFGGLIQPAGVVSPRMIMPIAEGQYVLSPTTGVVMSVERNVDSPVAEDYEVRVRAHDYSRWEIVLDHVAPPLPEPGLPIRSSFPIGQGVPGQPLEYALVDLEDNERAYCPHVFNKTYRAMLDGHMNDLFRSWEAYKNNDSIYDEAAMFLPGCAVERVPP